MYNRYVPGHNGIYERRIVEDAPTNQEKQEQILHREEPQNKVETAKQQYRPERTAPFGLDLGDLLLLCIVILLLIDSEEDDIFPLLIMAAAFLLQQ